MKDLEFIGSSLEDLKAFPKSVCHDAGYELNLVQEGREPSDWKPMNIVGTGVREIRIKDEKGIYRFIYIAKFQEVIYVLHVFKKKTEKTAKKDLNLATKRLKEVLKKETS